MQPNAQEPTASELRRARMLLFLGAIVGLALAAFSILEPARVPPENEIDVAALVNATVISRAKYERAVSALEQDKRNPLTQADRQHVLDRLIDEELLMQRAVALGLDRTNPIVRNTLVSAMIEIIVSGVGQQEPEDNEVEAFYEENRAFFARSDRYWVRQLRFPFSSQGALESADPATRNRADAGETANAAAGMLRAGERISSVARQLGGASVLPLPDGYLPGNKLREYLGPTPALRASTMRTGEVSDPIEAGSAWHVLQLVERIDYEPLPLSQVRSQVLTEMRRRSGDESLRAYLAELRDEAMIQLPER
jgi:peptidyl-prolyl cis-trans isomerase C